MNKLTAELVISGAQSTLVAKYGEKSIICTGLYDYPVGLAEIIVSSQPVRVSIGGHYKDVVYTERGIQLAKVTR